MGLNPSTNSNTLLWIVCGISILFMVAIFEIFFNEEKLSSKIFKLKGKWHWEIQKSLVDAPWNDKREMYNEIKWMNWNDWFTVKWFVGVKFKNETEIQLPVYHWELGLSLFPS